MRAECRSRSRSGAGLHWLPLAGLLLLGACTSAPNAPGPAAAPPVAADTPRTTPDGHRLAVPAGWSATSAGATLIVGAPEAGSQIVLVDVSADDADGAVRAAWAAYDAAVTATPQDRPLKLATDRPARDGWQLIRGYQYTSDSTRVLNALARRRGERWSVSLLDMNTAVADKRRAQVERILGSLLPKGYERETFAGRTAHPLDPPRIAALRRFVEQARQQLGVPGVAIGVVQAGTVLMAEGFGVRELGKPDPVDAQTLFMIASNTKALTTLMLAKQVDAGRLSWETPATQVLPGFRLGDAHTTRQVRLKHLVCACTGLPRQDMESVFNSDGATAASVLATLATMQPTGPFGELYQYSNAMASAAGFAGGHAFAPQLELGAAYDAAMQALVFDPLGMRSTTFDGAAAQRGNHAAPHSRDIDDRTVRASMDGNRSAVPSRPDGGAWSNVNDLLRYVQMELAGGVLPDGRRYIGEAPLRARSAQQVSRGDALGYAMGLKTDRTTGALLVHHGGSAVGYISDMLWLPEHGVGAVILTNEEDGAITLRSLFRRRLLELLFDGEPQAEANVAIQRRRAADSAAANRRLLTLPAEAALSARLAARYRSAELGEVVVARKGAAVWFDFGDWQSEVATRADADGTRSFVTVSPGVAGFRFVVSEQGGRRTLVLRDAQRPYTFAEAD